tara:strand:+ start:458 stop:934 length:477 start_codon:yes stop_codon:yes gene_type:complete
MKNFILITITLLLISNCTFNKVVNRHGVGFLEKKQSKLILNKTNKNDILNLLGPPSTISTFNSNLWIYIERNTSSTKITKLGGKELLANNVVILEINNRGMLVDKIFMNKDEMTKLKFSNDFTTSINSNKNSAIYNFLYGIKTKMNDPLGKKRNSIKN